MTRRRVLWLLLPTAVAAGWFGLLALERSSRQENYSLIEDRLYMGDNVRQPPPRTVAVLNLCEADDPYRSPVHVWEPIRDAEPAPDLAWLRRQVQFIDGHRKAGGTVFVHCRNGVSRSGLVVVAYLMFEHDWSRDAALTFARAGRPDTRPNPAFMDRLLDWERELRRRD